MTAFRAIVKITLMSAIRSKVFLSLLSLLLGAVVLIPLLVEGDGTALAHVKISIEYSLGAISTILSLSCVWIGCHVMSSDLEGYQAHMVMVKPVRRAVVWAGKYVAVVILHAFLLAVSCVAVFCLIEWRLSRSTFPAGELEKIRAEVLVGRDITHCELPEVRALVSAEFDRKLKVAEAAGQPLTSADKAKIYAGTINEVMSQIGEVKPGAVREFDFIGLQDSIGLPLSLRYKVFAGSFTTKKQYSTLGGWALRIRIPNSEEAGQGPAAAGTTQAGGGRSVEEAFVPLSEAPEKILSNYYYELPLPSEALLPGGKLSVAFLNSPESETSLFFQVNETPQILSQRTGFLGNFMRASLLTLMGVLLVSGISCSLGGLLSMPIAVFTVIAYLLFGTLSSYLIGGNDRGEAPPDLAQVDPLTFVGKHVGKALLLVITPLQKFDASGMVASGTLVEASTIWRVFALHLLLKGAPFVAIGIFFYTKREIGMIVRK